jgi:hypothetical protein
MERQTSIKKLFHEEGILFSIPSYQRAYSWEVDKDRKQVVQFLSDIKEQNPKKKYFFGHFLFEKDEHNETKFWVIDGQQRLTTIVIFMSCLIRELEEREKEDIICDVNGEKVEVWRVRELYIKLGRNYKFETVSYDNPFFESFVLNNDANSKTDSLSSKRIAKAKKLFDSEIKKETTETLLNWKTIVDDAVITTFELTGKDAKMQATQIFAFQNDRGKDLTTLEKLKAFLMHKLYVVSDIEIPDQQIKNIETVFADIYKQTERISFDEDTVLGYHNTAYLSGWHTPMKNVKEELEKLSNNEKKEKWIIDFVNTLKESFLSVEKIEKFSEQNCAIADVLLLDTPNSMPLLIKLFHFHENNSDLIERLIRKVEHILFKLEFKNADYRTNSLHSIAKSYKGNNDRLGSDLDYHSQRGFQHWWNFNGNCINYFNSTYHYRNSIKYVLWKYENSLRQEKRTRLLTPIEYKNKFNAKRLENTIDHITPQTPNFTEYSDEFREKWLNNIGNLTLMVWGDNSEKRNNNPIDKVDLFDSDFYSHKEIRDVLKEQKVWGEDEIIIRRDKIVNFVFEHWKLK